MTISSATSSSSASSPVAGQDSQVQALKAKIEDWATCPTTDSATKKSIVTRLTIQLDSLTASIESKAKSKAKEAQTPQASLTGRLNIVA